MKKLLIAAVLGLSLAACNNSSETKETIDSLDARKDTLLETVDSTTDAKIDSLKENAENLKDHFDSTIDAKKDSIKKQ